MKRLLMIAYHFPPLAGSSGIQRSLRFAQSLPTFGWQPSVLTVKPQAYERTSSDLLTEISKELEVERSFAFDASRHLSVFGRYPGFLARPDRWLSWYLWAIPAGLAMIHRNRPTAIWSTYPIPTAHLIACTLARISGLPWVADFRDPMAHEGYPSDQKTWQSYINVERKVFSNASRFVFSTPGAAQLYRDRYTKNAHQIHTIENGYDEGAFEQADSLLPKKPLNPGIKTLLHSGIVYTEWRNPRNLFLGLKILMRKGTINASNFRLRFRAPVHDKWLSDLANEIGVADIVEILPPQSYLAALSEMLMADGLLILQSADCNAQIPAKAYEYIRAMRPILALTDQQGDTSRLLQKAVMGPIYALESSPGDISKAVCDLLNIWHNNPDPKPNFELITATSRKSRTAELAHLLDEMTNSSNRQLERPSILPQETL